MQDESEADLAKVQALMDLDRRYVAAIQRVMPGSVTEALVAELGAILDAYERLHREGAPSFPFYSLDDVQRKMADTTEFIARAHESLSRMDEARTYYEQAAEMFEAIGRHEEAERCRAKVAQVSSGLDADIDAEIQRLRGSLDRTMGPTLERAQIEVELGELLSRAGDDFEAIKVLEDAEALLDQVVGSPSSGRMAQAFATSMADLRTGTAAPGGTELERMILARGLYLRTYMALARCHRETDPDKAGAYGTRAREVHADEAQVEEIMSQLAEQMGQPGEPGAP